MSKQVKNKIKNPDELIIANKELLFQNEEKEKRAAELAIANKELLFQNEEKEKRAAELAIANKQLGSIFNTVADVIFVLEVDKDGHYWFTLVNPTFLVTTGLYYNQLIGKNVNEIIPEPSLSLALEKYKEAIRTRKIVRWEETTDYPTGKRIGEVSIAPIFDETGNCIRLVGSVHDLTKRKKAEEEKIHLLDTLQKSLNEIYIFSPETMLFQYVNNGALKNLGYSAEEIKKLTHLDINPDYTEQAFKELVAPLINEEEKKIVFFTNHKRKDGSIYPVEVHLQLIKQDNQKVFLAVVLDITERKKAEENLIKYMKELKRSNTELEHFAYVASHDLQEPLRMVSSFLGLLEEELKGKLNSNAKEYFDFAIDGAGRMKILVNDLLLYSRVGTKKEDFAATDLNEVMEYVNRVLQLDIKKNRALITVKPLPVITANKTLITQLFVNLVGNGLKFHDGKAPEIEVGSTEKPDQWIFYVKDNGIGIDPKFFDKIFIIFQRLHLKGEYSGTGIGLAICKKIVEIHKGKIWVESEPGNGSTFYFSLPTGQAGLPTGQAGIPKNKI